jgi:hypothetical protein
MLFRRQPRFTRDRIPQLALQALHLGICPGVFQQDQCLSGAHDVAISDQDLLDDTALEVLDRLSARLGFDTTEGNRSALERCEGRPGAQAHDKAKDQKICCPGHGTKPVAQRRQRRFRTRRTPPNSGPDSRPDSGTNSKTGESSLHGITNPSGERLPQIKSGSVALRRQHGARVLLPDAAARVQPKLRGAGPGIARKFPCCRRTRRSCRPA